MRLEPIGDFFCFVLFDNRAENKILKGFVWYAKLKTIKKKKTSGDRYRCSFVSVNENVMKRCWLKIRRRLIEYKRVEIPSSKLHLRPLGNRSQKMHIPNTMRSAGFVNNSGVNNKHLFMRKIAHGEILFICECLERGAIAFDKTVSPIKYFFLHSMCRTNSNSPLFQTHLHPDFISDFQSELFQRFFWNSHCGGWSDAQKFLCRWLAKWNRIMPLL